MGVDVVLSQASEPNIEGVPWWATLIVVPILTVVLEVARRRMNRADADADRKPRHRPNSDQATDPAIPVPTPPPPPPPASTASADEKMLYVQMAIAEITASRDEARRDLAQCEQKLEEANVTIRRMAERQEQQDAYVARLQAMLDAFLPPGRPPTAMGPAQR